MRRDLAAGCVKGGETVAPPRIFQHIGTVHDLIDRADER